MDEDWQDAVFTSRHVHNRIGRTTGRGKSGAAFDVRQSFGTYALDAHKLQERSDLPDSNRKSADVETPTMEIYRLTSDGNGLIGTIRIPSGLECAVIFAGSRKTLREVTQNINKRFASLSTGSNQQSAECDQSLDPSDTLSPGVEVEPANDDSGLAESNLSEDEREPGASDSNHRHRFRAFEKNSFRAPKFWMAWQGQRYMLTETSTSLGQRASGMGYVVFSGNNCRKLSATISCEEAGWENVTIKGWKEVHRSARDTVVMWADESIEGGE